MKFVSLLIFGRSIEVIRSVWRYYLIVLPQFYVAAILRTIIINYNLACEPSQKGGFLVCLHPHHAFLPSFNILVFKGEKAEPL